MLDKFIADNDVLKTNNLINIEFLKKVQELTGLKMGEQLKTYILKYGFLIFKSMEFYGINSRQGMKSDFITQTTYLHNFFPLTKNFYAIGNRGDGLYILVDSNDNVFEFDSTNDLIIDTKEILNNYILNCFNKENLF